MKIYSEDLDLLGVFSYLPDGRTLCKVYFLGVFIRQFVMAEEEVEPFITRTFAEPYVEKKKPELKLVKG